MSINTETHNWSVCRGKEIVEYPALIGTFTSHFLLQRLRDHNRRGSDKILSDKNMNNYSEIVSEHNRTDIHMNSQCL